ncbi:MAG: endonuclease domain-containing protein [Thermodesulfovibrionales bacterium]
MGVALLMTALMIPLEKKLKKQFTDTEHLLGQYLRASQLEGWKFRRQQPIGNYIIDFVCFEKKEII